MTDGPNLKEIERKAYMAYHQDGLIDIVAAVYILGFGVGIWLDVMWESGIGLVLPATLIAVILPVWIAAKRKITLPRIGYVNFGIRGTNKLFAIFLGLMVAGLGVFFVFNLAVFQGGSREWLDIIFQNGLLVVGAGSLAVCALFGYSMGLKRLYAYGVIALTALVIGHFAGIFFAYILVALGILVMTTGITLLVSFVRKYPLKGDKAIAE